MHRFKVQEMPCQNTNGPKLLPYPSIGVNNLTYFFEARVEILTKISWFSRRFENNKIPFQNQLAFSETQIILFDIKNEFLLLKFVFWPIFKQFWSSSRKFEKSKNIFGPVGGWGINANPIFFLGISKCSHISIMEIAFNIFYQDEYL